MQTIAVSTVVRLPPAEVFDFLLDFTGYANYSKYLRDVTEHGDGGPGTEYDLHFAWWKLSYTARSRVTDVDRPHRIEWDVVKDIDAHGRWLIETRAASKTPQGDGEAVDAGEEVPPDAPGGSRVRLVVTYDPSSVSGHHLDLPRFVPLDYVVDKAVDLIVEEGERVVERVVADLEGEQRPVELVVDRDHSLA